MARPLTTARLRRRVNVPDGRKLMPTQFFDLRGLDQVTPHDVMDDSHSPFLRNARMYARDEERRRVAIRTRKGPGFYSVPIGETQNASQEAVTGAEDQHINTVRWAADKFEPTSNGRLTRVDLRLKNDEEELAIGNLVVRIHLDDDGEPGDVIATSSIVGGDIGNDYEYVPVNFIDAPEVDNTSTYWISANLQEGGQNNYFWSSTDDDDTALETNTSGAIWTAINLSLNFKTYISDTGRIRGLHRYYPTNEERETLLVHDTELYKVDDNDGTTTEIATGLEENDGEYRFDGADDKVFFVNRADDPKVYDGSTVEVLGGSPGDSRLLRFHKNRLFLVPTADPTRVNFSELGDYEEYGAVNFFYVPAPLSADPIQQMISFQDNLIIFTQNSKWTLSGVDLATFTLREALGKEGLLNPEAVDKDDNYIYFVSNKGFHRWNGSRDELLSQRVENEFLNIARKDKVSVVNWRDQVRIYYTSPGAPVNDRCLVWDKTYEEWFLDTDTPIFHAAVLFKDDNQLVEASDRVGAIYFAEQDYNILGKPIDFQYWTKYHSFGNSAARKQVRRFYPLLRSQASPFSITLEVDKDLNNDPIVYPINTQAEGAIWGQFIWGDGTVYGASALTDPRLTIAGQAVYWQFRFIKMGANTPVELLGYMAYPRLRRPK